MITKAPADKHAFTTPVLFTAAARVGFRHLLSRIDFGPPGKILLPAYIGITDREGSGVLDPIEEVGLQFDFYRLDRRLGIDMSDLEGKLKTGAFKALLIIHYFGFMQADIEQVLALCRKYGALLIEDCAHSMASTHGGVPFGQFGDFSFFSVHKMLPTSDGGMLQANTDKIELGEELPDDDAISTDTLLLYCRSNLPAIAERRRYNYLYLLDLLRGIDGLEIMYPQLDDGCVPMNMPVLIGNGMREELYFSLMDIEIPTIALYYRLIDGIAPERYPDSHYLSNNILNLPIHQDVTREELDRLATELRALTSN